ncbi:DUF397 domain-containing protein [Streptomyces sp. NPDC059524]|uniref:DUF397 domain-containing protein n=1 Tax=Streptomyces sp. NPDC059524 TaxID=3346856 RepID=UPI0036B75F39
MAFSDADLSKACWRKSSYSNGTGGDCVEVATNLTGTGTIPVRDTKHNTTGPTLLIGTAAWSAFLAEISA